MRREHFARRWRTLPSHHRIAALRSQRCRYCTLGRSTDQDQRGILEVLGNRLSTVEQALPSMRRPRLKGRGLALREKMNERTGGGESMAARRGRPRREDQLQDRLRQVETLFRREQSVLEHCHMFGDCRGAQRVLSRVTQQLPRAVYKRGTTLDLLLQGAALDVMGDLYATERPREEKLAQFIQAYFFEGRTIVDITTNVFGLSDRSNVSNHYRVEAFDLVARRFLTLVEHDDPLAVSSGLMEALERQAQRWDRAARRVSDALHHSNALRYSTGTRAARDAHVPTKPLNNA